MAACLLQGQDKRRVTPPGNSSSNTEKHASIFFGAKITNKQRDGSVVMSTLNTERPFGNWQTLTALRLAGLLSLYVVSAYTNQQKGSLTKKTTSHVPPDGISVRDRPHIWRWSHQIITEQKQSDCLVTW